MAKFNRGSVSLGLWLWNFLEVGERILGKLRLLGRLLKRREENKWVGSLIDSRNNEKLGRNKNDGKDFKKSSELWIPDLRKYYHGNTWIAINKVKVENYRYKFHLILFIWDKFWLGFSYVHSALVSLFSFCCDFLFYLDTWRIKYKYWYKYFLQLLTQHKNCYSSSTINFRVSVIEPATFYSSWGVIQIQTLGLNRFFNTFCKYLKYRDNRLGRNIENPIEDYVHCTQ